MIHFRTVLRITVLKKRGEIIKKKAPAMNAGENRKNRKSRDLGRGKWTGIKH